MNKFEAIGHLTRILDCEISYTLREKANDALDKIRTDKITPDEAIYLVRNIQQDFLEMPFPAKQVYFRIGQTNKSNPNQATALVYIDARTAMKRMSDALGVQNWETTTTEEGKKVHCELKFRLAGDKDWTSKRDSADQTAIEATKGGVSDAIKRAAVHLGVGSYLYSIKLKGFFAVGGYPKAFIKAPPLPEWAVLQVDKDKPADTEGNVEPADPMDEGYSADAETTAKQAVTAASEKAQKTQAEIQTQEIKVDVVEGLNTFEQSLLNRVSSMIARGSKAEVIEKLVKSSSEKLGPKAKEVIQAALEKVTQAQTA